jgi:hypothetical protein
MHNLVPASNERTTTTLALVSDVGQLGKAAVHRVRTRLGIATHDLVIVIPEEAHGEDLHAELERPVADLAPEPLCIIVAGKHQVTAHASANHVEHAAAAVLSNRLCHADHFSVERVKYGSPKRFGSTRFDACDALGQSAMWRNGTRDARKRAVAMIAS